jgi:16S rRNA (guanine966-N2)-methyltransferase
MGTIRIVGGAKRGHRLKVPKVENLRPTSEKVREAIFNVLGSVNGGRVLELFAGTGALGLEALSRGAASCVFVEMEPAIAVVLRSNIAKLGYAGVSEVLVSTYEGAAQRLRGATPGFDLLFVDPPYRMLPDVELALGSILPLLVAEGGVVVVEGPRGFCATFGQEAIFDRVYGDTRIVMLKVRGKGS